MEKKVWKFTRRRIPLQLHPSLFCDLRKIINSLPPPSSSHLRKSVNSPLTYFNCRSLI